MIEVVYQLFNALRFKTKDFEPLFIHIQKESEQTEENPVKLKIESLSKKSKSDTEQPTQLKQLNLRNQNFKNIMIKISRKDFASLIKHVVNNLDNKDYQDK